MNGDCPLPPGSLVWGYARHSPGERQTIHSQIKAIKDYCEKHGLIVVHIFVDEACKGSAVVGRDEFLAMIDASRQKPRPVEGIVFWAFDRLFRGYDQAQFYKADLRLRSYELISISEPLPDGPAGRLLEAAKDYMAEEELRKNSRAIRRGLDYLKARGCAPTGYPPAGLRAKEIPIDTRPNGSVRHGRVWEPDPVSWSLVVEAWQMRLRGATLMEIHKAVPLFQNSQSWSKFFRNTAYLDAGACTPEEWRAVQAMARPYREGGAYPRRKSSPYLLSGMALCAYCGSPVSGSRTSYTLKDGTCKDWPYYICATKKRNWSDCEAKSLKAGMVDQAVLSTVLDQVLTPERMAELVEETNRILATESTTSASQRAALEARLAELDKAISHLLDTVETTGLHAAQERLEQRKAERSAAEADLIQLAQLHPLLQVDEQTVMAAVNEMRRTLSPQNVKAAKRVLGCFVEKISLARDGGVLYYHQPLIGNREPLPKMALPIASVEFDFQP